MADYSIEAQPRSLTGKKVSQLRRAGLVPVTVYGPKTQPVNLQIPYRALEIALMKAGGTTLIDLTADGATHTVLAREVQRDVIKGRIMHVDFFAVDQLSEIRADIPLHFINDSPAVTGKRGVLVTGTTSVSVEVLPAHLPHFIEVDLSQLKNVGESITVADLKVAAEVKIVSDSEEMIAHISGMPSTIEEEEAAEAASAEPEVIAKGKVEEEDF